MPFRSYFELNVRVRWCDAIRMGGNESDAMLECNKIMRKTLNWILIFWMGLDNILKRFSCIFFTFIFWIVDGWISRLPEDSMLNGISVGRRQKAIKRILFDWIWGISLVWVLCVCVCVYLLECECKSWFIENGPSFLLNCQNISRFSDDRCRQNADRVFPCENWAQRRPDIHSELWKVTQRFYPIRHPLMESKSQQTFQINLNKRQWHRFGHRMLQLYAKWNSICKSNDMQNGFHHRNAIVWIVRQYPSIQFMLYCAMLWPQPKYSPNFC